MMYNEKKEDDKLISYWYLAVVLLLIVILNYRTNNRIDSVNKTIEYNDSLWNDLYYSIVDTMEKESYLVTVTTYNPSDKQTDKSPNLTSAQYKIDSKNPFTHKFIGLSRDLLSEFYYGEIVILENAGIYNGYYIVADCMNSRFLRHVDILIGKTQKHTKINNVVLKHANK